MAEVAGATERLRPRFKGSLSAPTALKLSDGTWGYTCPHLSCEDKLYGLKPDQNTAMTFARFHRLHHEGHQIPMVWQELSWGGGGSSG